MGGGFAKKLTKGVYPRPVCRGGIKQVDAFNIPLVVSRNTDQTGKNMLLLSRLFDQLMPGLVPLLLTFACMWLLRKKS